MTIRPRCVNHRIYPVAWLVFGLCFAIGCTPPEEKRLPFANDDSVGDPMSSQGRLADARLNRRIGKYDEALRLVNFVIEREPSSEALLLRADVLRDSGNIEEATQAYTKVIELDGSPAAYFARGMLALKEKRYEDAIADAIVIRDTSMGCLLLCTTYDEENQPILLLESARHWLETVDSEAGASVFHFRGRAWMQLSNYDLAARNFTRSLELEDRVNVRSQRAKAYFRNDNWAESIADAEIVLAQEPDLLGIESVRIMALGAIQNFESAIPAAERMLAITGDYSLNDEDRQFFQEQVAEWNRQMSLSSEQRQREIDANAADRKRLAVAADEKARAAKSAKNSVLRLIECAKSIRLDPSEERHLDRYSTLVLLSLGGEAVYDVSRALELQGEILITQSLKGPNPAMVWMLGRCQSNSLESTPQEALDNYNRAFELGYRPKRFYFYRALSQIELSNFEDALADLDKAVEETPDDERVYRNRSTVQEKLGNDEAAIADYSRYIELHTVSNAAEQTRLDKHLAGLKSNAQNEQ